MKNRSKLHLATAAALVSTATTGFLLLSSGRSVPMQVPAYTVLRVIDGDTFETEERQIIRLASVEAPESGRCGGPEAKKALEEIVIGKPVYLKVMFRDPYQRLVSVVYTSNQFVNNELLRRGYAYYSRGTAGYSEQLQKISEEARQKKLGIFGQSCTQTINSDKPSCAIKGNTRNGNIYYTQDCGVYDNVEVQLYLGDRWFCSEAEARKAGFRTPSQCP